MPFTVTEKLHVALAAKVAPVRLIELEPAVAVMVPLPQLPDSPFGVATTKPEGRVSVNPTPVIAFPELVLVTTKVKLVVPFRGTNELPKAAINVGAVPTDNVATEVLPVLPLVEVTVTLLIKAPGVVPVTFNEKVQLPPGARYP